MPDLVSEVGSTFSRTAPANTSVTKPLLATLRWIHELMALTLKRPELNLTGNISENFKNFEVRFNDYCVQADYRNLEKDPETEPAMYYKKPQLEIAALRSAMPDEALQVIRYTIELRSGLMTEPNLGFGWRNFASTTRDRPAVQFWPTDLSFAAITKH